MYVIATSPRLSRGRSIPATRAMAASVLSLPLLVPRVLADDPRHALTLDDLAVLAARLHRWPHLHAALLLEPVSDAAAREVVRRQLDLHAVAGQDADEVHAHLAAHVGEHAMAALQLHSEHRVRQRLHHRALHLDRVFFGHAPAFTRPPTERPVVLVSTSGPASVTAIVCSKCAARLPSFVTAVQPSSSTRTSHDPMVTIGSTASTMPAFSTGPRPGSPKFGICGSSCSARPMPCP